jgi:hypothetical protein
MCAGIRVHLTDGTQLVVDTPTGSMWSVFIIDADGQDRCKHLQPEVWESTPEKASQALYLWTVNNPEQVRCIAVLEPPLPPNVEELSWSEVCPGFAYTCELKEKP